jgi:hypothetical protein
MDVRRVEYRTVGMRGPGACVELQTLARAFWVV